MAQSGKDRRRAISGVARPQGYTPQDDGALPPVEEMLKDAGAGVSGRVLHRASWLEDGRDFPWAEALETFDRDGNIGPLLKLLRSEQELTAGSRALIADLLERHLPVREPGKRRPGKRTPAYNRSRADQQLVLADKTLRQLMQDGLPERKALEEAARQLVAYAGEEGIRGELREGAPEDEAAERLLSKKVDQLRNYHHGSRGSSNRMKRRRSIAT